MTAVEVDGVVHHVRDTSMHLGHFWTSCILRVWLPETRYPRVAEAMCDGRSSLKPVDCIECLAVRSQ